MSLNLLNPFRFAAVPPPVTGNGSWIELGRVDLLSSSATMNVQNMDLKKYLFFLYNTVGSGSNTNGRLRMFNNTAADYAVTNNTNGGSDLPQTNQSDGVDIDITGNLNPKFSFGWIMNLDNRAKLTQNYNQDVNTPGAGVVPQRRSTLGKMDTSSFSGQIDELNFVTTAGSYNAGAQAIVLGWDADVDTHDVSQNFWQPLAENVRTTVGDDLDVVVPARRWLLMETYLRPTGGTIEGRIRFNGSAAALFSTRQSTDDGAVDITVPSTTAYFTNTSGNHYMYAYTIICNTSGIEKLMQGFGIQAATGAGVQPTRRDGVGKYASTSQITSIEVNKASGTGQYDVGSFCRVWGSD